MSNPVRISRYTYDFASSKERLIFTERRFAWWKVRRIVLPLIAGALALWFLTRPAPMAEPQVEPESAKGTDKQGAYYEFKRQRGPVTEFTVKLTERL